MEKDTVQSIVELVRAAAPELSEQQLAAIATGIHRDLGGTRRYFSKAPARGKALCLGEQLAAGVPLAQAFAEVGVCRRWGYRLVARRWPVR